MIIWEWWTIWLNKFQLSGSWKEEFYIFFISVFLINGHGLNWSEHFIIFTHPTWNLMWLCRTNVLVTRLRINVESMMNVSKPQSKVDADALKLWRIRTAFQGSKKNVQHSSGILLHFSKPSLENVLYKESRMQACSSLSLWLVDHCTYHSLQMYCRSFARGSFPDLGHVIGLGHLQKFHQGFEHLLSAMAFVCHEYYKAFHWTNFLHIPQYKGQLVNVGCIGCRIHRDGIVIWFLNSRNDFS